MNYLKALVERSAETSPAIRPRLPTLFESVAGWPSGEALGPGLADDALTGMATERTERPVSVALPPVTLSQDRPRNMQPEVAPPAHEQAAPADPYGRFRAVPAPEAMHRPDRPAGAPSLEPMPPVASGPIAAHPAGTAGDLPADGRAARLQANDGLPIPSPAIRSRPETGPSPAARVAAAVSPLHVAPSAQAQSAPEPGQNVRTDAATVHIHIGRIEVRALPGPGPGAATPPSRPAPRRQSLEEYLAGGGGRS